MGRGRVGEVANRLGRNRLGRSRFGRSRLGFGRSRLGFGREEREIALLASGLT